MGKGSVVDRWLATSLALISGVLFLMHSFSIAWDFAQHSLQMDLATFYTAGEALRQGLDPYKNNYPTVWTGMDVYRHSGFLYPPIAAFLFQDASLVSYHLFKHIWTFLNPILFLVVGALGCLWLNKGRALSLIGFSLFAMAAMASFPLRIELERGQLDILLLLVVLFSLYLVEVRNWPIAGGLMLGLSAIFKLHTVYLIPFLLLRRHWRAALGSVLSLCAAAAVQYALLPPLTHQYVVQELPRISQYGPWGPAEWMLNEEGIPRAQNWNSPIVKQGRVYSREGFDNTLTASNASLARFLSSKIRLPYFLNLSVLSLITFLGLFSLIVLLPLKNVRAANAGRPETFLFWFLAMGVVLLSAPLTWSMATVWLLPISLVIPSLATQLRKQTDVLVLGALVTGLVLLVLDERPFALFFARIAPSVTELVSLKSIVAETLTCGAICARLRLNSSNRREDCSQE